MKITALQFALIVLALIAIPCLSYAESDPSQQAADQAACQEHAKVSSGYDPAVPQATTTTSARPQRGSGLRGAARGAAKGAIVGGTVEAVGDDSRYDSAAEIGAATGALAGASRSRRQSKQQAQSAPVTNTGSSAYTNSYNDCMASRGYTIY